jgi:bifunctional non-homologous end joining protein LigD
MTATSLPSASLWFREGTSDKVYHANIEDKGGGYVVNFSYGRRGSSLTTSTKTPHPVPYDTAVKTYDKLIAEKTAKGYKHTGGTVPTFTPPPSSDPGALIITTPGTPVSDLVPQLLNPITEEEAVKYINDYDWMMQEKFDGRCRMVRVDNCQVTGANKKGIVVPVLSEIADDLSRLSDCVLHGEEVGNMLYVHDLLEQDGEDHRRFGARDRQEILSLTLRAAPLTNVVQVETAYTGADKQAMWARLKREKKEGFVLKRVESHSVAGRPASGGTWIKVKFWESCTAMVTGIHPSKRSVTIALRATNGIMQDMGNCTVPTNYDMPGIGDLVEVKYLYAVGSLVQPQYKGPRDDQDDADLITSLKFKNTAGESDDDV